MIGVTADTNIYVSSLVFGGVPRQFIRAAEDGKFQIAISEPLIAEFREVLRRRFRLPEEDIAAALGQLASSYTNARCCAGRS